VPIRAIARRTCSRSGCQAAASENSRMPRCPCVNISGFPEPLDDVEDGGTERPGCGTNGVGLDLCLRHYKPPLEPAPP